MGTTTSIPAPEAQSQPEISPVGRVFGVFFSPKATFEDIVRKPSWILPVVLSTLFSICATFAFNQRVNWREYIGQQIEKNPQAAQLSAEQKQQRIEGGAKITPPITYAVAVCLPVLYALVVGLIMWGAYSLLGGANTTFGISFAITAHAALTGLITSVLLTLILYLKPYGTIDVDNPVATNLAVLLPEDSAKWLVALCKNMDLIVIWTLCLLAIGFRATSPKKLKGGKAFTIAFSVWAVWVIGRVGWAWIFS